MEFKRDEDPLVSAIDYWLKGNVEGASITWTSIKRALKSKHVDESCLAKRIERRYNQGNEDNGEMAGCLYNHWSGPSGRLMNDVHFLV